VKKPQQRGSLPLLSVDLDFLRRASEFALACKILLELELVDLHKAVGRGRGLACSTLAPVFAFPGLRRQSLIC
jgi:hypothetical protein